MRRAANLECLGSDRITNFITLSIVRLETPSEQPNIFQQSAKLTYLQVQSSCPKQRQQLTPASTLPRGACSFPQQ